MPEQLKCFTDVKLGLEARREKGAMETPCVRDMWPLADDLKV